METTISLRLPAAPARTCPISVTDGLNLGKRLRQLGAPDRLAVIADSTVVRLFGLRIRRELDAEGFKSKILTFPAGERQKNLRTFGGLLERMLAAGFDRGSWIAGIGGGVTGDLAGFVAGTYMRGIPFVQVPTTLLAMVDSSIGGKTAVDLRSGKNSAGLFNQPRAVLIDVGFLEALPDTELDNGMAEVIKHGIIRDPAYFTFVEKNAARIKARDRKTLVETVRGSCKIKSSIVAKDETEKGLRRILNFGHTVGHGLEALHHYRLGHGAAVSFGMKLEAGIAVRLGLLKQSDFDRMTALLVQFGLREHAYKPSKLAACMMKDKKNRDSRIVVVLPERIGRVAIRDFTIEEIGGYL